MKDFEYSVKDYTEHFTLINISTLHDIGSVLLSPFRR